MTDLIKLMSYTYVGLAFNTFNESSSSTCLIWIKAEISISLGFLKPYLHLCYVTEISLVQTEIQT